MSLKGNDKELSKEEKVSKNKLLAKPKRPMSAYNYFFREERMRILDAANRGPKSKKISFEAIGKMIGERWRKVQDEDGDELKKYKAMHEKDSKRYKEEMQRYYDKELALMCQGCLPGPLGDENDPQLGAGENHAEEANATEGMLAANSSGDNSSRGQIDSSADANMSVSGLQNQQIQGLMNQQQQATLQHLATSGMLRNVQLPWSALPPEIASNQLLSVQEKAALDSMAAAAAAANDQNRSNNLIQLLLQQKQAATSLPPPSTNFTHDLLIQKILDQQNEIQTLQKELAEAKNMSRKRDMLISQLLQETQSPPPTERESKIRKLSPTLHGRQEHESTMLMNLLNRRSQVVPLQTGSADKINVAQMAMKDTAQETSQFTQLSNEQHMAQLVRAQQMMQLLSQQQKGTEEKGGSSPSLEQLIRALESKRKN